MTPSSHDMLPRPGWYPDPYRHAELRWWDGAQWSEKASTADALGHSHVQYPMPPPTALAAPVLAPPTRRRVRWVLVLPIVLLLVVLAVAVGANRSSGSSVGVGAGGGIVFGHGADTTTTVDPLEVGCIVNSLAEDGRLHEAATDANASYSKTTWKGNEAFLDYGRKLSLVDLSDCLFEYSHDFQRYATARTEYGKWISQHTGLSHALAGSDRSGMRQLQAEIVAAYKEMMTVVKQYRPDLVRSIKF